MITRINESKTLTNRVLYLQENENVNLMDKNVKTMSLKNVLYVKKILYMKSWCIYFSKWAIFSKYYG